MRAVEMGATWFNDIHVSFRNLLVNLGLSIFRDGTSYFEASAAPAQEIQIPQNSPSYRVTGRTIETLKNKLIDIPVHLNSSS
jgi:monoamine oxidase